MNDQDLATYARTLDCIHCGLCLRTCPTYQLTGVEASSPRGRIALMRAVAEERLEATSPEYAAELDFCLVCRHCESVCPAGVRFGEMMEHARATRERRLPRPARVRFLRWLGFRVALPSRTALAAAHAALRAAQLSGATRLAGRLGARGAALAALPPVPPARERELLPERVPALGPERAQVALLEGCVMPELFGRVNRATASVLAKLGCSVRTARGATCCGALHAHNGDEHGARELGRTLIAAFEALPDGPGGAPPIVVNSAGCGAHMKDLGRWFAGDPAWSARAQRFAARVVDFSEYVAPRLPAGLELRSPRGPDTRIAYDDPCHLCHGQRIRAEPRAILDRLGGLRRVELAGSESCCGSAGIYSLLRPADAQAVLAPKLAELAASGAELLVTANPGCHMQWQAGLARTGSRAQVVHVAELLDEALPAPAAPPR